MQLTYLDLINISNKSRTITDQSMILEEIVRESFIILFLFGSLLKRDFG